MKNTQKIVFFSLFMSSLGWAGSNSFYCNGDLQVVTSDANPDVLNRQGEGFELDPTKHEVVHASLDGKTQFVKIQAFQKMKWSRESEGESFPSRFKFTTDKKTWFAIEAAMESDDVVRHLFCQHD